MPDSRTLRLQSLLWAAFAAACLWLALELAPILTPFLLAAILAYIGNPLVGWLTRHRLPRGAAALVVLLGLVLLVVLLILTVVPMVQQEALRLIDGLPAAQGMLQTRVAPWVEQHLGLDLPLDGAALGQLASEHKDVLSELARHLLATLGNGGLVLVAFVANLFLRPVVLFYLLRDWDMLVGRLLEFVPPRFQERARLTGGEVDAVLAEFLRGQLLVMVILATYYSLGLWLVGLKFALPVGLLTGLLVFVPYVGYGSGLVLACLAALAQFDGWGTPLGVAAVFGLGQVLESFILTPLLVGDRIGLHPIAVIFALLAFGQLFGFFGILLALPASAALLVGLRQLKAAYLASPFYRKS